ncbi:TetR family transcriptional regulator [Nocardia asteroides]|uniref:TetR family transcriptional regulator n=1 Tax=Nocardia asteroides TaxID=1824 RepID=UPI001E5B82F7|nr:TetR/AcrR family transcriptional regulator [Nocardia asteroides]UGT61750.1 TetR family transcriptional regulator [Nocardia asteroides]
MNSPAAPDLRARRRNATRIDIRAAALTLFERQGAERTTVDEIAAAAGISQRTFFRYFPTKEECVLFDVYGFDAALDHCLATTDPATLTLADVEAAFAAVIAGIGADEQSEVAATTRRIQKLVATDASLSRAAVARHADCTLRSLAPLDGRCSPADRARLRMIAQIAQIALHLAFEEWVEADADVGLAEIHRAVCARLRTL